MDLISVSDLLNAFNTASKLSDVLIVRHPKMKDGKYVDVKGTRFCNVEFQVGGVRSSFIELDEDCVIARDFANPENKEDPRNTHEGLRRRIQLNKASNHKLFELMLKINEAFKEAIDILGKSSTTAQGKTLPAVFDVVKLKIAEILPLTRPKDKDDPSIGCETLENPSYQIQIKDTKFSTLSRHSYAGREITKFFDASKTTVDRNGDPVFVEATHDDGTPVGYDDMFKWMRAGTIISAGSIIQISSLIKSSLIKSSFIKFPICFFFVSSSIALR